MKHFVELQIKNEHGQVVAAISEEIKTARVETKTPCEYTDNFDSAVEKIKARSNRSDLVKTMTARMGGSLAEHLEDKEGWHGVKRQDDLKRLERFHNARS